MSENVIIAILGLLGVISTGISGVLIAVISRQHKQQQATAAKVERVREQVENDHGTNMRDDLDVMRDEVRGVGEAVKEIASDLRGIRRDLGRLDRRNIEDGVEHRELAQKLDRHLDWATKQEDRIDALELILNSKEKSCP